MKLKLLMFLAITFIFIGNIGAKDPIMYMSLVDGNNGFGRIMNVSGESPLYKNHTLSIIVGDGVTWINNDQSDKITIVSDQKLWNDNDVVLIHAGRRYSYTFNNTGVYTFRIAEYDTSQKQTIIVSNIGDVVGTIPENITGPIEENITEPIEENITEPVEENITGPIEENITTTITNNKTSLIMSIFAPLNILNNLKIAGIIIFVIVVIVSLIKD